MDQEQLRAELAAAAAKDDTQVIAPVPEQAQLVVTFPARYVSVWAHTLNEFEKFSDATAHILPNGSLIVTALDPDGVPNRDPSQPPLKGYAPGAWLTFEHVGDYPSPESRERERIRQWQESKRAKADEDNEPLAPVNRCAGNACDEGHTYEPGACQLGPYRRVADDRPKVGTEAHAAVEDHWRPSNRRWFRSA